MKLLCLGDSLTYGFDVRPDQSWTALVSAKSHIHIDNEGQCGDTTMGMVYRLHQFDLGRYDAFFIMGGSNDILLDGNLAEICQNIRNIVTTFKAQGKPVYLGIPPLTTMESAMYGWQNARDVENTMTNCVSIGNGSFRMAKKRAVISSTSMKPCSMPNGGLAATSTPTASIPMPKATPSWHGKY